MQLDDPGFPETRERAYRVAAFRPGEMREMDRSETSWILEGFLDDITPETSDAQIDEMITEASALAADQTGSVLGSDARQILETARANASDDEE